MKTKSTEGITLVIFIMTVDFILSFILSPLSIRIANAQTTTTIATPSPNQNNTITSPATNTTNITASSSSNKTFYLFSAEHEGVNETKLGIPPDTYSPDILEVNTGDNVTVHFYNLDLSDRHTFTMGAPYNIDKDILPGKNSTFTFTAGEEGIYRFYCKYHLPSMVGQLIVLPPPTVEPYPYYQVNGNPTIF